ncbi:SusC/RagA family TonB-linked outer membrane protein [Anseongella ginsenosidimutans]|nr:SusC/RagA family TonB-linked outer membrane protein [Anseongella ginsenosidimutans]
MACLGAPFGYGYLWQDTTATGTDSLGTDTLGITGPLASLAAGDSPVRENLLYNNGLEQENPASMALFPAVSLQQYLKGQAAGLYVAEPSGEPGTTQSMLIRGTPMPILSAKDLYQAQPLVVLDGIPLIAEHPFAYDIQQYDFNRIGPATNLLANIDMDNIESVEVLKDVSAAAIYGPRAANGVIVLTSKKPGIGRTISFNSYVGMVQRPVVTTINGEYENAFRKQFYDRYTANGQYTDDDIYPLYLSDSLNASYYGPSNWSDAYYRNAVVYGLNASIAGGTDRANFRFSLGTMNNEGVADETGMKRYSAMFNVNMKPVEWLVFSAMINGNRIERDRNRSLRDRFAQMNYIPDLSAPLAPNKEEFLGLLTAYENGYDDNKTNVVEGYGQLAIELGNFNMASRFAVDYNEGYRDLYYPRALMEGNSYASNYYGSNQRLVAANVATYDFDFASLHSLRLESGQSVQWDTHKYNYAYAYKGHNDFIKLNLLDSDPKIPGTNIDNPNYLVPTAFPRELVYKFLDKTQHNLVSFYGRAAYNYDDKYDVALVLRADASSNAQPTERWLFTPALTLGWDIGKEWLQQNSRISTLYLRAGAGRSGRLNAYDNYSQGPQYTAEIGFTGNLTTSGYNGFGVLTRPYSFGWVGYGIPWAYSDQANLGLEAGLFNDRLRGSVDLYYKEDKNQLLGIPSFAQFGYRQSYESGMAVRNMGLDLILSGDILTRQDGLSWTAALNMNFNQNELTALPRGLDEIMIGNRLLQVGAPVDQYWLLVNEGIYTSDAEVPVVDGNPMKYNGIVMKAGDPRWKDINGDNQINDQDKVMQGNILPKISGGLHNEFQYRNWTLNLNLYFNLGREILNREMANRFDFINRESGNNINSVKEITYWEKRGEYNDYPLYNPWSTVMPYRAEQDLFLEDGSFLKLRTVSLGYDLTEWIKSRQPGAARFYIYASVNNVFTLTNYSGQDPELVNYTGYDSGYGLPIPRTYTLGIKMDLK